jgi:hypothetical protein
VIQSYASSRSPLDSLCVSTGYPSGMRPVRLGAGRGARGGEGGAWARACRACTFSWLFFLHAELQGPQIERQAVFPQKTGLSRKHRFKNENRGTGRRFLVPCTRVIEKREEPISQRRILDFQTRFSWRPNTTHARHASLVKDWCLVFKLLK